MILSGSNSTFKIFYLIKIEKKNTYLTCSIHIDIGVVCQGKCPSCFSIQIFAELRNYNFAIAVFFILMFIHVYINKLIRFWLKKKIISLSIYLDLLRKNCKENLSIYNERIHAIWFSFQHPWCVVTYDRFKAKHISAIN